MDELLKALKEFFTPGGLVRIEYKYFFGLFNSLYSSAASEIASTPSNFATVGESQVNLVTEIGTTVILPIAAAILAFNLAKELIDLISRRNNMADFDLFAFFKILFKTAFAASITSRCFDIVQAIFDMGSYIVTMVSGTTAITIDAEALAESLASASSFGDRVMYVLLGLIIGIIILICAGLILVTIWTRLINIYILIAVSPIPFATLLSDSQSFSSIGSMYVKNVVATALQGFIIALLMAINSSIIANLATNVTSMLDLLKVVILLITSTITVSKSLSLAKSVVGLAG